MQTRIMYLERKAGNLTGEARIGRVRFSKTGKTLYMDVATRWENWFKSGVSLVWVVNPQSQQIQILRRGSQKGSCLKADDEITGEHVFPHFCQKVHEFFPNRRPMQS